MIIKLNELAKEYKRYTYKPSITKSFKLMCFDFNKQ